MLRMKPIIVMRTRPRRSARPPTTTMKMPEKSAVIETAMFMTLVSTPRSSAMTGEMFSVVCAKSQKPRTPKMIPNRTLSFPTNCSLRELRDACATMGFLHFAVAIGPGTGPGPPMGDGSCRALNQIRMSAGDNAP